MSEDCEVNDDKVRSGQVRPQSVHMSDHTDNDDDRYNRLLSYI